MAAINYEEKKKLIERYVEVSNSHDIEEILAFYDNDCKITLDGNVLDDGMQILKQVLIKELQSPTSTVRLLKYLPVDKDDRIRALFEINSRRQVDETYVLSESGRFIELIAQVLVP